MVGHDPWRKGKENKIWERSSSRSVKLRQL